MLKSALRYIRQKPKAVRNQYALFLASIFTVLIAFIWLTTGNSSLGQASSSLKASEGNTPFSGLIKQAKDQFASSKAALTKVEETSSTTSSSTVNSNPAEMILSTETLERVNRTDWSTSTAVSGATSTDSNFGFSGKNETDSSSTIKYIEVQIATTTSASTTPSTSPQ